MPLRTHRENPQAPPRYHAGREVLRRLVVLAVLVLVGAEIFGVPHVRLHQAGGSTVYWSVTGRRAVPASSSARPPVMRMFRPEPSLAEGAGDYALRAWERVQQAVWKE